MTIPGEPVEVERKYLVKAPPDDLDAFPHKAIRQGYMVIGEDGSEARLRDQAGSYTLTVKTKGELSRGEWEIDIAAAQFDALWPTTVGRRVVKTRYAIPYQGLTIELDIYGDALEGLLTAEVEFASVAAADRFEAPAWFGQELTRDPAFKNQQLAVRGRPSAHDGAPGEDTV